MFNLDPKVRNAPPVAIHLSPAGIEAGYRPDPSRSRFASAVPEWSTNLTLWTDVPAVNLSTAADGRVTVLFPAWSPAGFLHLRVAIQPVD